jgi:hypothetical protein
MSNQKSEPRERKKIQRLILRDISCSPDDRFIRRFVEESLPEDAAILSAYEPRLLLNVRVVDAATR